MELIFSAIKNIKNIKNIKKTKKIKYVETLQILESWPAQFTVRIYYEDGSEKIVDGTGEQEYSIFRTYPHINEYPYIT
jgi:hypothetical protein